MVPSTHGNRDDDRDLAITALVPHRNSSLLLCRGILSEAKGPFDRGARLRQKRRVSATTPYRRQAFGYAAVSTSVTESPYQIGTTAIHFGQV